MSKRLWFSATLALAIAFSAGLVTVQSAQACGGFFCQNSPIDQNAERIIFTQNHDGTVSAYIQIQYTGSAPDFSWILPLPEAIGPEDIEVPEDAMAAFAELEIATDPVFIPPPLPQCVPVPTVVLEAAVAADSVEVFASGEVGPYGFDVIGSEDPDALIIWLRDNNYRVTEEMEPLISVYVDEAFVFLAMRLLPEQGDQDVQPVKITYPAEAPMIPLRLTAVAANQNMSVMTWFYADKQAMPVNYAKIDIADEELVFFGFGGSSNYRQLMGQKADEFAGQAFITEYAAPTRELVVSHPLLQQLGERYPYVTRLNTVISPDEMTVDPIFGYDPQLKDVSNIHDLSGLTGVFDCERQGAAVGLNTSASAGSAQSNAGSIQSQATTNESRPGPTTVPSSANAGQTSSADRPEQASVSNAVSDDNGFDMSWRTLIAGIAIGGVGVILIGGLIALGLTLGRRSGNQA